MRITILAHGLRAGGGVVVGQNLIRSLVAISKSDEWLCTVPSGLGYEEIIPERSKCELIKLSFSSTFDRYVFDHYKLSKIVKQFNPDIVLVLGNIGLTDKTIPQAVFLHQSQLVYDTKHYGFIGIRERLRYAYLKWRFRNQLSSTCIIFCQTEVMKKRIIEKFNYSGKVDVVGTSVDTEFNSFTDDTTVGNNGDIFKILYLTRYYTHKNIEILINIFDKYREELQGVQLQLTIDASQHKNASKLLDDISNKQLNEQIINLGPIQKHDLDKTYKNSDAVIIPTLIESFGITYIEAMIAGKPIMTSNLDFAHVQCGDAAIYFDPWDEQDICLAILKLKGDAELRNGLLQAAKNRLKFQQYEWEDIAKQMYAGIKNQVNKCN